MKRKTCTLLLLIILISALLPIFSINAADSFDLSTAHIGVMTGSTGEIYAKKNYPKAEIESYANIMDAVVALGAGKLEAVITADITATSIVRENTSLMIDEEPLFGETVSAVTRKDDSELLGQINEIIARFKEDGTLADMEERWMNTYPPVKVDIPKVSGEPLKIGVTATRPPFSSIESDGTVIGFGPELAYRIGEILGREISFVITDFASLIPALQSNKTDAIVDLIVYTDERAQFVDFSDVYYITDQVVLRVNPNAAPKGSFVDGIIKSIKSNLIDGNRWLMIVNGLGVTVKITFFAFILATLLGFAVCWLNMSNVKILNILGSIYLTLMRGIPMVVVLMITYFIIFKSLNLNPVVVAIVAFGVNSAASISELLRSAILTVDKGQIEAARSMGFSGFGAFITVTFPQAVRVAITTYKSEFVALFKGTSIVGYIAIIDLTKAGDMIRASTFDAFFPLILVALIYLATVSLIVYIFNLIIKKTDKRSSRRAEA